MRVIVAILLLTTSQLAMAEVSDKVPHEVEIMALGAIGATVAYFAASRKWWFGVVGVALTGVAIAGAVDLLELREALWLERGLPYFLAIAAVVLVIAAATSAGIVRGLRRP